jgi:hypothetical protein
MNTATRTAFAASSLTVRGSFGALALAVTLSLLASVSGIADRQMDQALIAQANANATTQVVVITGQRLPRG